MGLLQKLESLIISPYYKAAKPLGQGDKDNNFVFLNNGGGVWSINFLITGYSVWLSFKYRQFRTIFYIF